MVLVQGVGSCCCGDLFEYRHVDTVCEWNITMHATTLVMFLNILHVGSLPIIVASKDTQAISSETLGQYNYIYIYIYI
jgi:hypothetical protein